MEDPYVPPPLPTVPAEGAIGDFWWYWAAVGLLVAAAIILVWLRTRSARRSLQHNLHVFAPGARLAPIGPPVRDSAAMRSKPQLVSQSRPRGAAEGLAAGA